MKRIHKLLILSLFILTIIGCETDDITIDPIEEMSSGTINGQIESIDGVSIQVRLLKDGELVAQIETDGSFELIDLEEGNYTIQISAKGFEMIEKSVTVVAGQDVSLDKVTLVALADPVSHIRGVLKDGETGDALSEVLVHLMDESGAELETLTSNDGIFTFENLPVDQAFTLTIMHDGYEDSEVEVKPITADETYELDVELTPIPELEELPPGDGLSIGSEAPAFELPDGDGVKHKLSDYVGDKHVVVVFYRGGW